MRGMALWTSGTGAQPGLVHLQHLTGEHRVRRPVVSLGIERTASATVSWKLTLKRKR